MFIRGSAERRRRMPLGRAISALAETQFPLVEPGSKLEQRVHLAIVVKLVCDRQHRAGCSRSGSLRTIDFVTSARSVTADWWGSNLDR